MSVEHEPGAVGDFCEFVKLKDGTVRCRLCKREYDPDAPPAEWEEVVLAQKAADGMDREG